MPLVTRAGDVGQLFKQAAEPGGWVNGDMWVDTDNANVAVNRSGTAVRIAPGTLAAGDVLHATATDTIGRLALGTAGQVLLVNTGATDVEYGAGSLWEVLGDYEAASQEGTHTFSFTAVDFDDDSEIVVVMDLTADASLAISMEINGLTSGYAIAGRRII